MRSKPEEISELLRAWNQGDPHARDELMPLIYDELRRVARAYVRREQAAQSLEPTALVHEAFLRLAGQEKVTWENRAHFFGIAARLMRQVLVNHAEARRAAKRGGSTERVALSDIDQILPPVGSRNEIDLLALNEAMERLEQIDQEQCRIVELRYFSGLTIDEVAEVMNISPATVKREWNMARAWLRLELSR